MKRKEIIKHLLENGNDDSGVLIEKASGSITKILHGKSIPIDFEYHTIQDISIVNNTIVIRISDKGM